MNVPQDVETLYHGILFPSKREAVWAVFLDVMNIHWVYEPSFHALTLKRGLPYFWIPCPRFSRGVGYFIKIRPRLEVPQKELLTTVQHLAMDTGRTSFIYFGDPGFYTRLEYSGTRGFIGKDFFSIEEGNLIAAMEPFLYGQEINLIDWDSLNKRIVGAVHTARRTVFDDKQGKENEQ